MSNVVDTTIHQAATSGDAALVQRLVEKQKAPVNTKDKVRANQYGLWTHPARLSMVIRVV